MLHNPVKQQSTGKFTHVQKSYLILLVIDYYYFLLLLYFISIDVNPSSHHSYPPVHILFRYFKYMTCGERLRYSTNMLAALFSLGKNEGFAPTNIFAIVFEVDFLY